MAESIRLGRRITESVAAGPTAAQSRANGMTTYQYAMQLLPQDGVLGVTSSMTLVLIFLVASFVFVPRTLLCLGAGATFGFPAIFAILPGTMAGGILAFLAARYLFHDRVQRYVNKRPRLQRIASAVDQEGWRFVALLRFASPLPNALQNYMFGLTKIGIVPFALATFFFTIPQIVMYVYLGSAGRAAVMDDGLTPLSTAMIVVGAVSMAVAMALVLRRVRAQRPELFDDTTLPVIPGDAATLRGFRSRQRK